MKKKTLDVVEHVYNTMLKKVDDVFESDSFNVDDFEDNYILPKIIMHAISLEISWQYEPEDKKQRELSHIIYNKM